MEATLVKEQFLRTAYTPAHLNEWEASMDSNLRKQHKYADDLFHSSAFAKIVEQFILQKGHELNKGLGPKSKELLWNMELNTFEIAHAIARTWRFFLTVYCFCHSKNTASDFLKLENRFIGRRVIVIIADHGIRGHGYHEFLQLAINLHSELASNIIIVEPPPEFERHLSKWVEVAPSIVLKVCDQWRIDKCQFIGVGYGGGILIRLLLIAAHRFRSGTHILMNARYPEGVDLPEKYYLQQIFKKFEHIQLWSIRMAKTKDAHGKVIPRERSTDEVRKVGEKVLSDNLEELLKKVVSEMAAQKLKDPEGFHKHMGAHIDEVLFSDDIHHSNIHWAQPLKDNQALLMLLSVKALKCFRNYLNAEKLPSQKDIVPCPLKPQTNVDDSGGVGGGKRTARDIKKAKKAQARKSSEDQKAAMIGGGDSQGGEIVKKEEGALPPVKTLTTEQKKAEEEYKSFFVGGLTIEDYGLIRDSNVLINKPEQLGFDPFVELPAIRKFREEELGLPDLHRPIIVGKDMNPVRKLRLEIRQQEIMNTLAVGGLETHAEDERERHRQVLWCLEETEKNVQKTHRENEAIEMKKLFDIQKTEAEQQFKLKKARHRANYVAQNFGSKQLRAQSKERRNSRWGMPGAAVEGDTKLRAIQDMLNQPAIAPAEVLVSTEIHEIPQVPLHVDTFEDENEFLHSAIDRIIEERNEEEMRICTKKVGERQKHIPREQRLANEIHRKRELKNALEMYEEQQLALLGQDKTLEAVLELSKAEVDNSANNALGARQAKPIKISLDPADAEDDPDAEVFTTFKPTSLTSGIFGDGSGKT